MAIANGTDSELVTAWLSGDHDALAAIYDRYADSMYAYALTRARNRADAADIVQDVFLRAAERLGQLRDRTRLRAWLYAIARTRVIDGARRPTLHADTEEIAAMPADHTEPTEGIARAELAELVWVAADGLNERDRELLTLHLQHGLDGADLADVVGMPAAQLYVSMNRLKERMAKAIGALLIARHGSKHCEQLRTVLAGWDGRFTLDVRSRVTRHVEHCDECSARRALLVSPDNLSAAASMLPAVAPAALRETVMRRVRAGEQLTTDRVVWRNDGFPTAPRRNRRATVIAAATAAVIVVAGALVAITVAGRSPSAGPRVVEAVATTGAVIAEAPLTSPLPTIPTIAVVAASTTTATTVATTTTTTVPTTTTTDNVTTTTPVVLTPPPVTARTSTTVVRTTVAATTIATTAPTSPPPTAPPPAPGRIVLVTTSVDLGATATTSSVRLRNDGGQAASWSATVGLAAFSVAPASGSLEPGQETTIQVGVNRATLAEGNQGTTVTITSAGGGGNVTAAARVERPPVFASLARTPPVVRTSSSCGATLVSVVATVDDESGLSIVDVLWSSDGLLAQRTTLTADGTGRVFTGQVGSFSSAGTRSLTVTARDTRGNSSTSTTSVVVSAC
ncbi:MAG: sigma-70 family RNA polymerase sigma factor [Ilumatobacteraceae bacterium]